MNKIAIFALLSFVVGMQAHADEWYKGGSLHGSTMDEWSAASSANKLATSSDFIVSALGEEQVFDPRKLKDRASDVVECVDTLIPIVGESYDAKKEKVTSIALLCINQFNANEWK